MCPPQSGWTLHPLQHTCSLLGAPVPLQQGNHRVPSTLFLESLRSICSSPWSPPRPPSSLTGPHCFCLSSWLPGGLSNVSHVGSLPCLAFAPWCPLFVAWSSYSLPFQPPATPLAPCLGQLTPPKPPHSPPPLCPHCLPCAPSEPQPPETHSLRGLPGSSPL